MEWLTHSNHQRKNPLQCVGACTTTKLQWKRVFTDDHSLWTQVEPISCKNEVLTQYKSYKAWLDTQHHAKIKCLQMDCRGEYLSEEFNTYLKACGTV